MDTWVIQIHLKLLRALFGDGRLPSGIFDWLVEIYHCSFPFDYSFSQIGSPNLLLANKHATVVPLRVTWISNRVRAHRLGQPKIVCAKWVRIGSDRSCLRDNKNEGSGFSVLNDSINFGGPMKWSISPWLCHRSLGKSRCLDLEMPYALLVWIQMKWVWHWRGFTSSCRFGLKGKKVGMVGFTGRFRAKFSCQRKWQFQWMLCMKISKERWVTSCWFS